MIWLVIGVIIYFSYGRKHSRVQMVNTAEKAPLANPAISTAMGGPPV
jgi:hypothetical protein